jgi:hypothetical protein
MMGSMMRRAMIGDSATLNVDFTSMTNGGQLANAGFTFTNATTTARTYINASGIVATATTNEPRFDHDPTTLAPRGLLIEGQATNRLLQSNDWNTTWNNPAAITWDGVTYATAPDGTNTAKQITVTAGSSAAIGQAVTTGTNRTISLWMRAGSITSFSIGAFDAGGTSWGNNVDSTCTKISGPGSVTQQVGGLWSITGLSTTQWTRIQIFRSSTYTTFLAYPGSSSGTINGTAYMWGMQMEDGNGASSLIPTGASTATRVQDLVSITSTNFSSWWTSNNPASFLVDVSSTNRPLANHIFRIADSSGSAYGYQSYFNSTTMPMQVRAAMSSTAASDVAIGTNLAANTRTKIGFTVETASLKRFRDGSLANTLNTPALPPNTLTQMYIGGTSTFGNSSADFHIRQFKYWPITLSDAVMQGLTT